MLKIPYKNTWFKIFKIRWTLELLIYSFMKRKLLLYPLKTRFLLSFLFATTKKKYSLSCGETKLQLSINLKTFICHKTTLQQKWERNAKKNLVGLCFFFVIMWKNDHETFFFSFLVSYAEYKLEWLALVKLKNLIKE